MVKMATQDFFSKYWLVGVIGLLLVLNALWMVRLSGEVTPATEGQSAPEFSLPRLGADDRSGVSLSLADLRGKVVVLDFWATWCPPCLQALPSMAALDRSMRGQGVAVVGVLTGDADLEQALRVADEAGVRYPVVVDPDGEVARRFAAEELPTVVVVDGEGVIRATEVGLRPPETLVRTLRSLVRP